MLSKTAQFIYNSFLLLCNFRINKCKNNYTTVIKLVQSHRDEIKLF